MDQIIFTIFINMFEEDKIIALLYAHFIWFRRQNRCLFFIYNKELQHITRNDENMKCFLFFSFSLYIRFGVHLNG